MSMKHLLMPDAWRSEAFAEDLFEERHPPSPQPQRGRWMSQLVGLLPVLLATAGALFVTWGPRA